jgi:hypothetical protein
MRTAWHPPDFKFKLPDEVEWRYPRFPRDILDRKPWLAHLRQEIPRPAEPAKRIVCQQHGSFLFACIRG